MTKTKIVCLILMLLTMGIGCSVAADWYHLNDEPVKTSNTDLITKKPTDRWRLNSDGKSQRFTALTGTTRDERAIQLIGAYNHADPASIWETFIYAARVHQVYPEVLLCVTYADTSIGTHLKTKFNWGNVGNNDRGDKVGFINIEQGINAIADVLNNKYLGTKNTIGDLSPYEGGNPPFYATSPENWEVNVLNCMGMIHNKKVNGDFAFRW